MSPGISRKITAATLLALLWQAPAVATTASKKESGKDPMLQELDSETPDVRRSAMSKILAERQESNQKIADLLAKYLAIPDRKGTAKDLILLLGKLRATEQVPLLVRSLTLKVFYRSTKRPQTIEDLYPAVQALADIGAPAIDPVLERLQHEDDEEVQRTGAAVLRDILGLPRAALILDNAMQTAATNEAKVRLKKALQAMQQLP